MMFDIDGIIIQDTLVNSTTTTEQKNLYHIAGLVNVDKKGKLYFGFGYNMVGSTRVEGSTTTTYASQDMGPAFRWVIGKQRIFSIAANYNILAKAQYTTTGSTQADWSGTSYLVRGIIQVPISEQIYLGVALNYYLANYVKSVTGSTSTDVSYSRTMLLPTITSTIRF